MQATSTQVVSKFKNYYVQQKRASYFILAQDALLRRFNVLIRFYDVKKNVYRPFGVSPNSKRADRASRIALISNLLSTPSTFHIAGKNLE